MRAVPLPGESSLRTAAIAGPDLQDVVTATFTEPAPDDTAGARPTTPPTGRPVAAVH